MRRAVVGEGNRRLLGNEPLAEHQLAGQRSGTRQTRDRRRQVWHVDFGERHDAPLVRSPWSGHLGMMAALSPGQIGIVASLTFKCWATISGGEWVSQSDNDTSA